MRRESEPRGAFLHGSVDTIVLSLVDSQPVEFFFDDSIAITGRGF